MALVGSSHAASWSPPLRELAAQGKIRLLQYTKNSCRFTSAPASRGKTAFETCGEWNELVLLRLLEHAPDVALIANHTGEGSAYGEGLAEHVRALGEVSRVALIRDVPNMGLDPLSCLSQNLQRASRCAPTRPEAEDASRNSQDQRVAQVTGSAFFDLNDWICGETCPLIQGDVLTYKDSDHLTATFSRLFAPVFEGKIVGLLDQN